MRVTNPELAGEPAVVALRTLSLDLETTPDAGRILSAALAGAGVEEVHLLSRRDVDGAIVHPNIKFDAAPAAKPAAAKVAEPKKTGATGKPAAPKKAAVPKAEAAPAAPVKTAAVAKSVGGKVKKAAPIVAPIAKAAAPKKAAAKPAAAKSAAAKPATAKTAAAKPAKGKK